MSARIKITPEILAGLDKLIQKLGSVYKLAQELGVAHSTILFWKSGKTTKISAQLWQNKLKFLLRPYLTEDVSTQTYIKESVAEYGTLPQSFYLVSLQNMGNFDPNVESVISYISRSSVGQGYFSNVGGKTLFAVLVDQENFAPIFPYGTILLVESGRPACDGEIVLVKFREEKLPKAMIFHFREGEFSLIPLDNNAGNKKICWQQGTNSLSFISWQYPLIESTLKLSSKRW